MGPVPSSMDLPYQRLWVVRGKLGTGALPTANQVINLPVLATHCLTIEDVLNNADNTSKQEGFGISGAARNTFFAGLYLVDVSLFQDVDATLQLQDRTVCFLEDALGGNPNTLRTVYTRQVKANRRYQVQWRLFGAEARIVYTNGGAACTIHDLTVTLRAL